MADVSTHGVEPPKRIAGGFGEYPLPGASNVKDAVKMLVDRQHKHTTTGRGGRESLRAVGLGAKLRTIASKVKQRRDSIPKK